MIVLLKVVYPQRIIHQFWRFRDLHGSRNVDPTQKQAHQNPPKPDVLIFKKDRPDPRTVGPSSNRPLIIIPDPKCSRPRQRENTNASAAGCSVN